MRMPILQLSCNVFIFGGGSGKTSHHPGVSAPLKPSLAPCDFWFFPKLKSPLKGRKFVKCDSHTVHKLSQRRLTADWLAPRESDCSRINIKVSSDWLPSYIKPNNRFSRNSKLLDTFQTGNYAILLQNKYIVKIWVAQKRWWYFVNCIFTCLLMTVYFQSEDGRYPDWNT